MHCFHLRFEHDEDEGSEADGEQNGTPETGVVVLDAGELALEASHRENVEVQCQLTFLVQGKFSIFLQKRPVRVLY